MKYLLVLIIILGVGLYFFTTPYIEKNSKRYAKLLEINDRFAGNIRPYDKFVKGRYNFDSKAKFDNVKNRHTIYRDFLYNDRENLMYINDSVQLNSIYKGFYLRELEVLNDIPSIGLFSFLETKVIENAHLVFDTDFSLEYVMMYTSPQGRNRYRDIITSNIDEVREAIHYVERNIVKKSAYEIHRDAERAKVTSGMRYDIFKRDEFTCQACGASSTDHGVTLHLDHIQPVSKGGMTEDSNLQTLCADCNLGKSDKL